MSKIIQKNFQISIYGGQAKVKSKVDVMGESEYSLYNIGYII